MRILYAMSAVALMSTFSLTLWRGSTAPCYWLLRTADVHILPKLALHWVSNYHHGSWESSACSFALMRRVEVPDGVICLHSFRGARDVDVTVSDAMCWISWQS